MESKISPWLIALMFIIGQPIVIFLGHDKGLSEEFFWWWAAYSFSIAGLLFFLTEDAWEAVGPLCVMSGGCALVLWLGSCAMLTEIYNKTPTNQSLLKAEAE
jgi:hypothetical protein